HSANTNSRSQFAAGHHRPQVCPGLVDDVGGVILVVFLNVLLVSQYPGYFAEVDTVLRRQDASGPHPGRHGVGAHADFLPLQVLGRCHPRLHVIDDRGVVELAHDKDRQSREGLVVSLCCQVGGDRHLGHVEFQSATHTTEGRNDRGDFDVLELDARRCDSAVFQALCVGIRRDSGLEDSRLSCSSHGKSSSRNCGADGRKCASVSRSVAQGARWCWVERSTGRSIYATCKRVVCLSVVRHVLLDNEKFSLQGLLYHGIFSFHGGQERDCLGHPLCLPQSFHLFTEGGKLQRSHVGTAGFQTVGCPLQRQRITVSDCVTHSVEQVWGI